MQILKDFFYVLQNEHIYAVLRDILDFLFGRSSLFSRLMMP